MTIRSPLLSRFSRGEGKAGVGVNGAYVEDGEEDEEGVDDERHDVRERGEGERHGDAEDDDDGDAQTLGREPRETLVFEVGDFLAAWLGPAEKNQLPGLGRRRRLRVSIDHNIFQKGWFSMA